MLRGNDNGGDGGGSSQEGGRVREQGSERVVRESVRVVREGKSTVGKYMGERSVCYFFVGRCTEGVFC